MAHTPDNELSVPYIEPGTYKHYKGNLYEVIGVALNSETLEPVVVYKSLNKNNVPYWVRPYDMFVGMVTVDGQDVQRFNRIDD